MSIFKKDEYLISKFYDKLNDMTSKDKTIALDVIEKLLSIQNKLFHDLGLSDQEINSICNNITNVETIVARRICTRSKLSLETVEQFIKTPNSFMLLKQTELN